MADIFETGVVNFGLEHAVQYHDRLTRTFELLASAPMIARLRHEFHPPVRVHPSGAHVIIYRVRDDGDVQIVRVRHGREDWGAGPVGAE